ncbi:unnamed protein product [Clonostachys solani]|uniref:D-xylose 1-dehydrogenase (NADP(+), D-xylono-1,5-lactone-forming) n=1 Tax=Clonostachys solani TaxID=160281 RepID=A0A9P0EKB6_9HYPO|nr:unnamed protein product [Clonostachys solani]
MANKSDLPTLKWGIVGCGTISSRFVSDLCLGRPDATTKHVIEAVGSSSMDKASAFVAEHCPAQKPALYDSYEALYNHVSVDIVYIGTPHVLHCENALGAIAAGKHVLCEKPFALNALETRRMIDAARAKGVFLMEGSQVSPLSTSTILKCLIAVWTRFFPVAKKFQSLLHDEKAIGDIASVFVDFGLYMPISIADPTRRTASRALGAGALLDLGIYTLTWASLALDTALSSRHPNVVASMAFASETNPDKKVDEFTSVVLQYPDLKAHAICTSSLLYKSAEEFAHVYGSKGSISVGGHMASRPQYLVVRLNGEEERRLDFNVPGFGFYYEADAVGADIRAGRLENRTCSLDSTLAIMSRMDNARVQCGLTYPQEE